MGCVLWGRELGLLDQHLARDLFKAVGRKWLECIHEKLVMLTTSTHPCRQAKKDQLRDLGEVTELPRLRGSLCFGILKSNLSMLESHCLEKKLALERPRKSAQGSSRRGAGVMGSFRKSIHFSWHLPPNSK